MATYSVEKLPGRTLILEDGKKYLWFSGTDYLGLAHDERFRNVFLEGISQFGTHFGSSRSNNLQLDIYKESEEALAHFVNAPEAITVSSGMWAGQLLMQEMETIVSQFSTTKQSITYYYAPGTHPAIRGQQYISSHGSWTDWANTSIEHINASNSSVTNIICTDSVGSPWVQNFDFSIFSKLTHPNTWLIVDDSHGIGVRGNEGGGIYQSLCHIKNVIVCTSLNKGMGIPGGAIFAARPIINYLKTTPGFAGASPYAPAYAYTLKTLLRDSYYQNCNTLLLSNIQYLQSKLLNNSPFVSLDNYPVYCSKNPALFDYLIANDIMASHFPYPSPIDSPITRLAISTLHTKKDLDRLAEVSIQFQQES
mgnify:CR=1 FL=1